VFFPFRIFDDDCTVQLNLDARALLNVEVVVCVGEVFSYVIIAVFSGATMNRDNDAGECGRQTPQPAPRHAGHAESSRQDKPPLPVVRKKDREYQGMFEFKKGDEQVVMIKLVYGKDHSYKV